MDLFKRNSTFVKEITSNHLSKKKSLHNRYNVHVHVHVCVPSGLNSRTFEAGKPTCDLSKVEWPFKGW